MAKKSSEKRRLRLEPVSTNGSSGPITDRKVDTGPTVNMVSAPPVAPVSEAKEIWASIFGLDAILSWTAVGCLVPGLVLGLGIAMLTVDWFPHYLLISQLAFTGGCLLFVAKIVAHALTAPGSASRRSTFTVVMLLAVSAIWWEFCWNVQQHKNYPEPEAANFAIRVTKNIVFPPNVGQRFRVDTHYQNYATHAIRIRIKSAVVVIDGTIPYYSLSPEDQYSLQNKAWREFYGPNDDLGSQNPTPPYMNAPPLEESWFSDMGHKVTQKEYDDFKQDQGKLLIFTFVKLEWKDTENGNLHGYDTCKFTSGDVSVLHDCNAHNGPYKPKDS